MEDFVTYDLALKLKDKGFNWICSHYYRTKCKDLFMVFPSEDWSNTEERINAPTISQVLKWLIEEKKIYLELVIVVDAEYMCDIYKIDARPIECLGSTEYSKTYEAAALAGIEYVLYNLI